MLASTCASTVFCQLVWISQKPFHVVNYAKLHHACHDLVNVAGWFKVLCAYSSFLRYDVRCDQRTKVRIVLVDGVTSFAFVEFCQLVFIDKLNKKL